MPETQAELLKRVFVVIPAFKEKRDIAKTLELVGREYAAGTVHGIIVVDDGSMDFNATSRAVNAEVRRLGLEKGAVKVVRHFFNRGKANAVLTGFKRARDQGATAIVTVDADTVDYPSDGIARMLSDLEKPGVDMVVAGNVQPNDRGISSFHPMSGQRAFQASAFNLYFEGNKTWRRLLDRRGYGLETSLNFLFEGRTVRSPVVFRTREPFRGSRRVERRITGEIARTLRLIDSLERSKAPKIGLDSRSRLSSFKVNVLRRLGAIRRK